MNREIKFRAWETNKGLGSKMSEPFTLTDLHNRGLGTFGDNYEFMQFTGLLDKNGKEIYEGDVINHDDRLIGFIKYLGCSFIIEWIGIETYSDLLGWDNWRGGKLSDGSNYEIIGNIYQNPELLETVQK